MNRHLTNRLAPCVLLALTLAACSASTGAPSPSTAPNATFAVAARAAIDAVELLRVQAQTKWFTAKLNNEMTQARYNQLSAVADTVEAAEQVANAELAVYLATGEIGGAREALQTALTVLAMKKLELSALTARSNEGGK
jgi:hypothetical protein